MKKWRIKDRCNPGWAADSLHGAVLNPDGNEAPNTLTLDTNWEVTQNGNNEVTVATDYGLDDFDNDGQNGVHDDGEQYEMTPQNPSNKSFAIETDDVEWLSGGCAPPTNAAAIASLNDCYSIAHIKCFEATGNTRHTFDFRRITRWDNFHANAARATGLDVAKYYSGDFRAVAVFWSYEGIANDLWETGNRCEGHTPRPVLWGEGDPENEGAPDRDGYTGNARLPLHGVASDPEETEGPTADVFIEAIWDFGKHSVMWTAAHEIRHLLA